MARLRKALTTTGITGIAGVAGVLALTTWYADRHPAPATLLAMETPPSRLQFASMTSPRNPSGFLTASEPLSLAPQYYAGLRLAVPVVGVQQGQLSDTFTQARAGGMRSHDAIDIMAPQTTPVVAAADGRVEKLFVSRDGGNTVYVRSADGRLVYYYAHLDSYAPGLAEGMALRQGDAIGSVGYSGNANPQAPHLHFAMFEVPPGGSWYHHGAAINPYPLLARQR